MRTFTMLLLIMLAGCAPQKQPITLRSSNNNLAKDSVVYYETDFETRQKNYLDQMQGKWNLASMQRQARLDKELLSEASIVFSPDMKFTLTTACGEIKGRYDVKGTGVRFVDLSDSSDKNCANSEQQTELLRLLKERVSAYTVSSSELLLRDNATNIVFVAMR